MGIIFLYSLNFDTFLQNSLRNDTKSNVRLLFYKEGV
jgi:hypothetical protein